MSFISTFGFLTFSLISFDSEVPFSLFKYDVKQESNFARKIQTQRILYLTGITYSSSKNWSIWLNNDYYDPTKLPSHFQILTVTPISVNIRLETMDSDITLSLGDGVCTQSGKIYRKFS